MGKVNENISKKLEVYEKPKKLAPGVELKMPKYLETKIKGLSSKESQNQLKIFKDRIIKQCPVKENSDGYVNKKGINVKSRLGIEDSFKKDVDYKSTKFKPEKTDLLEGNPLAFTKEKIKQIKEYKLNIKDLDFSPKFKPEKEERDKIDG